MRVVASWEPTLKETCDECRQYEAVLQLGLSTKSVWLCLDCLRRVRTELKEGYKAVELLRLRR